MDLRTCKKCHEAKALDLFVKNKTCPQGVEGTCKKCSNEQRRAMRLLDIEENRRKARESAKRDRQRHPEKHRQRVKEWGVKNPEKRAALLRAWEEKNKGRRREINKKSCRKHSAKNTARAVLWASNNPDARRVNAARYSKKHSTSVSVSYAAGILASQTGLKIAEIPVDLAEVKRLHILVKRELRKQTKPNQTP